MRIIVSVALACALLGSPSRSVAQDRTSSAAHFFRTAQAAFERREYVVAAKAFEHAYQEVPAAASMYNAGRSWQAAGEKARAATSYARALGQGGLTDEETLQARQRLTALQMSLGAVSVTAPSHSIVSIGGISAGRGPSTIYLEPGTHEVHVAFDDGTTRELRVNVAAKQTLSIGVEASTQAPVVQTSQGIAPAQAKSPPAKERRSVVPESNLRWLGWTALGAGLASAGLTAYLGIKTLRTRNEFADSGYRDQDAHERTATLRLVTDISLVGTVAFGITGGIILYKTRSRPDSDSISQSAVRLSLQCAGTSVILRGTF